MGDGTKKQMVDFISSRCTVEGKKITKTRLNRLTREELQKFLSMDPEMEQEFRLWVERENSGTCLTGEQPVSAGVDGPTAGQMIRELERLVDDVVKDPHSFLKLTRVRNFMEMLPYGVIPFDKLSELTGKVMPADLGLSVTLLNYAVKQEKWLGKETETGK